MEPPDESAAAAATVDDSSPDGVGEPKKKKGPPLVAILFIVGLIGGGAGGFFMYERLVAAATGTDLSAGEPPVEDVSYGVFHEIGGIIVNPAESGGKRYLMISLGLEVANEGAVTQVTEKEVVIRDQVLALLGSHSADELADIGIREELKTELVAAINRVLGKDSVNRLYFTQYVLQ